MDNKNVIKLKALISEIDDLIGKRVTSSSVEFRTWYTKTERFIINYFGKDSYEHTVFKEESFSLSFFMGSTPDSEFIYACREGLLTTKGIFLTYLEEISLEYKESENIKTMKLERTFNDVFIVHGHDGELREKVARLLEKQNIKPIILNEKLNRGATIIEKFEENSKVAAAIALFTTDDEGRKVGDSELKKRARQNVIFETGYLMGKIGRDNVILLSNDEIDIPSDLSGIVYINKAEWEIRVLKELRDTGYSIDLNKL